MRTLETKALPAHLKTAKRPVVACFVRKNSEPSARMLRNLDGLPEDVKKRVELLWLDIDTAPEVIRSYQIHYAPELLIFHKNELVEQIQGAMEPEHALDTLTHILDNRIQYD